jgi:hypothetical protein
MNNRRKLLTVFTLIVLVSLMTAAQVQAADRFFNLALVNPIQIFPEGDSIGGIRLNLIYGKNVNLTGLDIGIANKLTGSGAGLQYGLVHLVDGDFAGWQNGLVSITRGKFQGLQEGVYSYAEDGMGVQWGFVNHAGHWNGLMFGFVNWAGSMKGLQIGLVNVIRTGGFMPVFPIVNWSF